MDVMVTVTPSPDLIDHVSPDPLDIFHAFPSCSLSSHLPECCDLSPIDSYVLLERNEVDCFEALGTFRGYNPSLNPYSTYLEICMEKSCWLLHSIILLIFPMYLLSLGEHLLSFLDSCLCALTYIHLSCMFKCSTSSCEL